jgi:hypothetical protein
MAAPYAQGESSYLHPKHEEQLVRKFCAAWHTYNLRAYSTYKSKRENKNM